MSGTIDTSTVEKIIQERMADTGEGPEFALAATLADFRHWCDKQGTSFAKIDRQAHQFYLTDKYEARLDNRPAEVPQHKREFPHFIFEAGFLDLMEELKYIDNSWHNDVTPCFIKPPFCVWPKSVKEGTDYVVTMVDADGHHAEDVGEYVFKDFDGLRDFLKIHADAAAFAEALHAEIGDENYQRVRVLNTTAAHVKCCASHVFCDANMVMLKALKLDYPPESSKGIARWNAVWEAARERYLTQGSK